LIASRNRLQQLADSCRESAAWENFPGSPHWRKKIIRRKNWAERSRAGKKHKGPGQVCKENNIRAGGLQAKGRNEWTYCNRLKKKWKRRCRQPLQHA